MKTLYSITHAKVLDNDFDRHVAAELAFFFAASIIMIIITAASVIHFG